VKAVGGVKYQPRIGTAGGAFTPVHVEVLGVVVAPYCGQQDPDFRRIIGGVTPAFYVV